MLRELRWATLGASSEEDAMERRSPSKVSRRSLIALAGGAVGGVLVGGLGKPEAARAGDGDALLLGRNNSASTETLVLTSGGSALRGESTNDVAAVPGVGQPAKCK